jgi:hypothetical protein
MFYILLESLENPNETHDNKYEVNHKDDNKHII